MYISPRPRFVCDERNFFDGFPKLGLHASQKEKGVPHVSPHLRDMGIRSKIRAKSLFYLIFKMHVIPTLSAAKTEGPYDGQDTSQRSVGILLPMAAYIVRSDVRPLAKALGMTWFLRCR